MPPHGLCVVTEYCLVSDNKRMHRTVRALGFPELVGVRALRMLKYVKYSQSGYIQRVIPFQ